MPSTCPLQHLPLPAAREVVAGQVHLDTPYTHPPQCTFPVLCTHPAPWNPVFILPCQLIAPVNINPTLCTPAPIISSLTRPIQVIISRTSSFPPATHSRHSANDLISGCFAHSLTSNATSPTFFKSQVQNTKARCKYKTPHTNIKSQTHKTNQTSTNTAQAIHTKIYTYTTMQRLKKEVITHINPTLQTLAEKHNSLRRLSLGTLKGLSRGRGGQLTLNHLST